MSTCQPIQKVIIRRMAAQRLAVEGGIGFRQALREIDTVAARANPAQLAAAADCMGDEVIGGLFAESFARVLITRSGQSLPVTAIGDGEFLKWLFSDEGRAALIAWAEAIVKIVAILAPLFV